jgi:DNA-binding protein HU-beta
MPGKSELADRIAARGWSKAAASSAVDAVLGEITAALTAGERVTLTGFGTFESAPRGARTARNPRTGDAIEVPATTIARFHPGATLRAQVAAGTPVSPGALSAGPVGALAPVGNAAPAAPVAPVAVQAPAPKKAAAKAPAVAKAPNKASKKADALTKAELKAAERAVAKAESDAKKAAAKKAEKAKAAAKKKPTKAKADAKHGTKHKKK